jgi:hypothetical protein
MTHDLLHDYIMGKVESKWKDIFDSPLGTYEQLKISLGKIGFSKYFVDGHFESVSALNRRFGKALVRQALLEEPLHKLVETIVSANVQVYSNELEEFEREASRDETVESPLRLIKTFAGLSVASPTHQLEPVPFKRLNKGDRRSAAAVNQGAGSEKPPTSPVYPGSQPTTSSSTVNTIASQTTATSSSSTKVQPLKGDDSSDSDSDIASHPLKDPFESPLSTPVPLPHWIHEIHELGAESKIGITFVNDVTVPLRKMNEFKETIAGGAFYHHKRTKGSVRVFHSHALKDDNQDALSKLRSFILDGVKIDFSRAIASCPAAC